jgi:molybdopterin-guanine dinucleotide biosynthesis protein A
MGAIDRGLLEFAGKPLAQPVMVRLRPQVAT